MPVQPPQPPTGLPYKSISASTLIKTGEGDLFMLKVSSSTSLTVRLYDNTAASGTVILASMLVDAKEEHFIPARFSTGLYVEFVSGSGALTVFYV